MILRNLDVRPRVLIAFGSGSMTTGRVGGDMICFSWEASVAELDEAPS